MKPLRGADLHTLAGPYALGALPPRERGRFERHLAACPACAEEVRSLRETTARLAAATAAAPADRLREKVLAEVARTRQLPPVTEGRRFDGAGGRRLGVGRWVSAARRLLGSGGGFQPVAVLASGAFLVAAIVSGTLAITAQHRLSQAQASDHMLAAVLTAPDAKMMSTPVAGGGTATVVMSHMAHALAFSSAELPSLPAGKAYELWLMGPPGDRSAAMLPRPDARHDVAGDRDRPARRGHGRADRRAVRRRAAPHLGPDPDAGPVADCGQSLLSPREDPAGGEPVKSPLRRPNTRCGRTWMVAFCAGSRKSTRISVPYLAFIRSITRCSSGGSVDDPGGALDHHRVGGVLGGDAAPRVGGQVAGLAGAGAAAEPQHGVVPHAPDRHRVRPAVRPHARHPVVARRGEPLSRPGPGQQAAALGRPPRCRIPACTAG